MRSITSYTPQLPAGRNATPRESGVELHEFADFWGALRRRWRLFSAIVAGFVLLVAIATVLTPKSYTTTARLMAGNPNSAAGSADNRTSLPILNALVLQSGEQSAETFATLAQQDDVAADVVNTMQLQTSPETLLQHLSVKPIVNTPLLNVSVSWRDPQNSARIANAFANAFINRERDFVRSQAVTALGFLSGELPAAESQMRQTANALADFQANKGFVDAGTHTRDIVSKATDLESKIESANLDRREATALLANASRQLASLPSTVNNAQQISVNPILSDLQAKLENVRVQLTTAEQQYTDQHPTVISLRKQRDALLAQIASEPATINSGNTLAPNPVYQALEQQAAQYKQRIDGDAAQLTLLQQERANMAPLLRQLPQQSVQLATLQERAKLASDVYNALEQKYNDATIAKTTAISDITVVQPAVPGQAVKHPSLRINLAVALLVGLLLAAIIVFIIDALERRVRETEDARVLGLPIIARVPAFSPVSRRMLPWVQSMTVEAFLHLCVSLRLKTKRPLRTLAVTSPSRGDGKTTITYNLGKAMATLRPRVLLIDADMRRPTLHEQAGCTNEPGLSDVLTSSKTLGDCVREIAPNLDLLPSGATPSNPVSLLEGSRFDELLDEAGERYSMIILDSPALSSVTDGLLLSARVDGTVFVVSASSTHEAEAKRMIGQFSTLGIDNVLGIVLNKDEARINDYSDYFARGFQHSALSDGGV